jgi:DNA-binding NarL/FixJ family response regulator
MHTAQIALKDNDLTLVTLNSEPQPTSVRANLTPRQDEVLNLLMQGKSNKEIAREMGRGEGTVKVHMAALFRVLGVRSRVAAAVAGERRANGANRRRMSI